MTLTLTQISSYTGAYLADSGPPLATAADDWPFHTLGALNEHSLLEWTGVNGPVTGERLAALHAHATTAAEPVAVVAGLGPSTASVMMSAKSAVMTVVGWCLEGGYYVSDDLTVTDITPPVSAQVTEARQKIDHWLQSTLREAAGKMEQVDREAARAIDAHTQMLDQTTNADGTVKNPTYAPRPPVLINEHGGQTPVPADPRDHVGSTREIVDAFGKIAIGTGTEIGGVMTAPVTGGASLVGTVPGGAIPLYDGLDDLSHLTNGGRLPGAPPIIGQDGPG